MKDKRKCKNCKSFKYDPEYRGLGECDNELFSNSIVTGFCDMFLVSKNFRCKYYEEKKIEG